MDRQKVTWIVLGLGVVGLWWFYRSRRGLPVLPGMGSSTPVRGSAGPTTQGSPAPAPAPSGSRTINDPDIVAARGAATGSGSRAACGLRWIKTIDGPYYGLCVDEATLGRWNAIAGGAALTATTAQVKATLGLR